MSLKTGLYQFLLAIAVYCLNLDLSGVLRQRVGKSGVRYGHDAVDYCPSWTFLFLQPGQVNDVCSVMAGFGVSTAYLVPGL